MTSSARSKKRRVALSCQFGNSDSDCIAEPAADQDALFLGSWIPQSVLIRSKSLSAALETGSRSFASLRKTVSPDSIQLWVAACLNPRHHDIPTEELVTILQVADELHDRDPSLWVNTVTQRVLATDWSDNKKADAMTTHLLHLPSHNFHSVLEASKQLHDKTNGNRSFFDVLPHHLHSHLLAANISSGKLSIAHKDIRPILAVLPGLPGEFISISTLEIHLQSGEPLPAVTGSILAAALGSPSHASLSSLQFAAASGSSSDGFLAPEWLRAFRACIRPKALVDLVSLSLRVCAYPSGCAETAECLRHLSSLTSLTVVMNLAMGDGTLQGEPCSLLGSYTRLVTAPACLPTLQELVLQEVHELQSDESCAHLFLSVIKAPKLAKLAYLASPCVLQAMPLLRALSASRFPALQDLSFECFPSISDAADVLKSDSTDCRLPNVAVFELTGVCPASLAACGTFLCQQAFGSLSSLTLGSGTRSARAELTLDSEHSSPADSVVPSVRPSVWHALLKALGPCTALLHLDLACFCAVDRENSASFCQGLGSAIENLVQLTELSLRPYTPFSAVGRDCSVNIDGDVIAGVLPVLKGLQKLSIGSSGGHGNISQTAEVPASMCLSSVESVVQACCHMPDMKCIELPVGECSVGEAKSLLGMVSGLEVLELRRRRGPYELQEYDSLQAAFPAVKIVWV